MVLPDPFRSWAVRLALAADLTLLLLGNLAAQTPENKDPVGPEVRDAFSPSETARVVIFLEIPPVPAEHLAHLQDEVSRAQETVLGALSAKNSAVSHRFQTVPALAGDTTAAGFEKLADHPGVLRVDLNARTHACLAQSVPLVRANQFQAPGYRGQGITVAILDTGVGTDHPDLSDNIVGQERLVRRVRPRRPIINL